MIASRLGGGVSLEFDLLGRTKGFQSNGLLGAPTACLAARAWKQDRISEDPSRCRNKSKTAWVQIKSSCLHDVKTSIDLANWAPTRDETGVESSFCHQRTVERLWQSYFTEPTEWWDNRNNKLHFNSPDFRHKSTKEALWIDSWSTPQWVTKALGRKTSSQQARGDWASFSGHCRSSEDVVHLRLPQWDTFSWTALITQYTKRGQGSEALKIYEEMREGGVKAGTYTFVAALKACSSLQDLESAKHIHAEVVKSGYQSDTYVGTMLVNVYSKCESLMDARLVFEKMACRDAIAWNAMIFGYAQMEEGEVALELYARMKQEGVVPDDRTFIGALRACNSLPRLEKRNKATKQLKKQYLDRVIGIHSDILKSGCELNVYVGNMLVDAYSKAGSLVDARHVFEAMPHHDVVSWTVIILAYANLNEGDLALQLYARMQQNEIVPDNRVFIGVLKACSSLSALDDARMIGVTLTKRCLEQVRAIHSDIVEAQFESNIYVGTTLVDIYAKCGSLVDARHVFEKMAYRNTVAWNAMILGYAQREEGEVALELYRRMQQEGVVPNERTFVSALKACSSLATPVESAGNLKRVRKHCLDHVRAIHTDVVNSGRMSAAFVGTMLVDMYARCGSLLEARFVFENMPYRDVVAWTAMILGYAQMEEGQAALDLYAQMQQEGVVPDARAFVGALMACRSLATIEEANKGVGLLVKQRCLHQVQSIHRDIVKRHLESDAYVGTMLVDVFVKCGSLVDARQAFENMPGREVSCWNAMILGYAQTEEAEEALRLFARMQQEGQVPNERTFVGALQACGSMAGLKKGIEIHAEILTSGIGETNLFVPNALVDMYGKCGSMVYAQQVFDALPAKDILTWSALLAGYARQGDSDVVFEIFQRMKQEGIQPNNITFLHVLTVCSHVGLVNKGQKYFEEMSKVHGITPTAEHYICMVDLFGRAGQLDKALEMVNEMPSQPDNAAWKCLLGACRLWSNTQLGRVAFDCAVSLNRKDVAAYVLMCSIYAAAHMWEKVKEIEEMKLRSGAWKQPGQTWCTDLGGTTHAFAVGD